MKFMNDSKGRHIVDEKIEVETGSNKSSVTRRTFISYLLGFSVLSTLGGVLTPVIGYLWPPARSNSGGGGRTLAGDVEEFPLNNGKVVLVNNQPVMVVNTEAGGIKAFSAVCTHLGCITYWHEARQVIQCPCHDGRFNPLSGAVISGPPPVPLAAYELEVMGGQVYVGQAKGPVGAA